MPGFDIEKPTLLFHGSCFDGIASAAYLLSFFRTVHERVECLEPVYYSVRGDWLDSSLPRVTYIVDFLFHPEAQGWWDHHSTAFLTDESKTLYETSSNPKWVWNPSSLSCAIVIRDNLRTETGYDGSHLADLVRWATVIDSAQYENPEQAVLAREPALAIASTLPGATPGFQRDLVYALRDEPVDRVVRRADVRERYNRYRDLELKGRERLAEVARIRDGIVLFDVDVNGVIVNRYAPFLLFPDASFSLGVSRGKQRVGLLVMRNPWKDVPHPDLGELCSHLGGGGHRRVGAIVFEAGREQELAGAVAALTSALAGQHHGSQVQSV